MNIYDRRASRRGLRTGPEGVVRKRLNADGTIPYRQGGLGTWSEAALRETKSGF